jgi:putative oxidoreductase
MAAGKDANWGTLVPRFLLGVVFVYHGGQKLFGLFGGEAGAIDMMTKMIGAPPPDGWGWPMPGVMARAAAVTEFFGGACLLLGLLTRFWAAGLAFTMFVAFWKVHGKNGFGLQNGGFEYNFVLGFLALYLVVAGGGAFSVDEMFFKKKAPPPPK